MSKNKRPSWSAWPRWEPRPVPVGNKKSSRALSESANHGPSTPTVIVTPAVYGQPIPMLSEQDPSLLDVTVDDPSQDLDASSLDRPFVDAPEWLPELDGAHSAHGSRRGSLSSEKAPPSDHFGISVTASSHAVDLQAHLPLTTSSEFQVYSGCGGRLGTIRWTPTCMEEEPSTETKKLETPNMASTPMFGSRNASPTKQIDVFDYLVEGDDEPAPSGADFLPPPAASSEPFLHLCRRVARSDLEGC